ncbi:MAG: hypothetical protein WDN04_18750 [Rhodospirillales bacterium]
MRRMTGVHDLAADILEIDIDAVRRGGGQLLAPIRGAIIDGRVETQVLDDVAAFLGAAGYADHAHAEDLADLADDGADGTAGGGDQQRFPGFRRAEIRQAEIGGKAGAATDIEQRRQRDRQAGGQHLHRVGRAGDRIILPAEHAVHQVAGREIGVFRGDDLADAVTAHDFAELHRRHVLLDVGDPDAVRGIEREIERADQRLSGLQLGGRARCRERRCRR